MWRVLCVDDDPQKANEVAEFFTSWQKGNPYGSFTAVTENSFEKSLNRLSDERFDLVTLDLHGSSDPEPKSGSEDNREQEGKRVLDELKKRRFVPVIFYTGYADKISELETGVVKIVKKGQNDLEDVRNAAQTIYKTGLPELVRHIEKEERSFVWDTIDQHWDKLDGDSEQLSYLLARRLAAQFNHQSVKTLLGHKEGAAKPIEHYIYPAIDSKILTGNIYCADDGNYWIVMTPSCDFAQDKVERVLLAGASPLSQHQQHVEWSAGDKWKGEGSAASKKAAAEWDRLRKFICNKAGDRTRFLPGTFFIPDILVDIQVLKQMELADLKTMTLVCQLDNPYRQELILHFSRYYGRLGTPDLEISEVFKRL